MSSDDDYLTLLGEDDLEPERDELRGANTAALLEAIAARTAPYEEAFIMRATRMLAETTGAEPATQRGRNHQQGLWQRLLAKIRPAHPDVGERKTKELTWKHKRTVGELDVWYNCALWVFTGPEPMLSHSQVSIEIPRKGPGYWLDLHISFEQNEINNVSCDVSSLGSPLIAQIGHEGVQNNIKYIAGIPRNPQRHLAGQLSIAANTATGDAGVRVVLEEARSGIWRKLYCFDNDRNEFRENAAPGGIREHAPIYAKPVSMISTSTAVEMLDTMLAIVPTRSSRAGE